MKTPKPKTRIHARRNPLLIFKPGVPVYSLKPKILRPIFRLAGYQPFSPFTRTRPN